MQSYIGSPFLSYFECLFISWKENLLKKIKYRHPMKSVYMWKCMRNNIYFIYVFVQNSRKRKRPMTSKTEKKSSQESLESFSASSTPRRNTNCSPSFTPTVGAKTKSKLASFSAPEMVRYSLFSQQIFETVKIVILLNCLKVFVGKFGNHEFCPAASVNLFSQTLEGPINVAICIRLFSPVSEP